MNKFMIVIRGEVETGVFENITGVAEMLIRKWIDKVIGEMTDERYPGNQIIVVRTSYKRFEEIRRTIETKYPNLCSFQHL
mgnify:CR=1 FL=1